AFRCNGEAFPCGIEGRIMDDATGVSQRVWWRTILENRYIAGPIKFLLPFGIGIILFAILYLLLPYQDFLNLSGLLAAYFIPPAGKESIIPIAIMVATTGGLSRLRSS
ncbi:MAG TPA: hypothetical protein PK336_07085, partial [Methanoculleus sp.]|nr:hypothetical protein [Methanoculleus sp.]